MTDEATSQELGPEQRRALACVLDRIVPPSGDGHLPGAGALDLVPEIEAGLEARPELRPGLLAGLEALEAGARERGAAGFADLAAAERAALLDEVSGAVPAFLPPLVFQTFVAYYAHPRVLEALGHPPRPPYPEGYPLAPFDEALLEPVRRREPFYRRA